MDSGANEGPDLLDSDDFDQSEKILLGNYVIIALAWLISEQVFSGKCTRSLMIICVFCLLRGEP